MYRFLSNLSSPHSFTLPDISFSYTSYLSDSKFLLSLLLFISFIAPLILFLLLFIPHLCPVLSLLFAPNFLSLADRPVAPSSIYVFLLFLFIFTAMSIKVPDSIPFSQSHSDLHPYSCRGGRRGWRDAVRGLR